MSATVSISSSVTRPRLGRRLRPALSGRQAAGPSWPGPADLSSERFRSEVIERTWTGWPGTIAAARAAECRRRPGTSRPTGGHH